MDSKYDDAIYGLEDQQHSLAQGYAGLSELVTSAAGDGEEIAQQIREAENNARNNRLMLGMVAAQLPRAEEDNKHNVGVSSKQQIRWLQSEIVHLDLRLPFWAHNMNGAYYIIGRSRSQKTTELLLHSAHPQQERLSLPSCLSIKIGNSDADNLEEKSRSKAAELLLPAEFATFIKPDNDRYVVAEPLATFEARNEVVKWTKKRQQSKELRKRHRTAATVGDFHNEKITDERISELEVFRYVGRLASIFNVTREVGLIFKYFRDLEEKAQSQNRT